MIEDCNMGTHRRRIEALDTRLDQMDRIIKKLDKLIHLQKKGRISSSERRQKSKKRAVNHSGRPKAEFDEEIESWIYNFEDPFDTWEIVGENVFNESCFQIVSELKSWEETQEINLFSAEFEEDGFQMAAEVEEGQLVYDSYADDESAFEEESVDGESVMAEFDGISVEELTSSEETVLVTGSELAEAVSEGRVKHMYLDSPPETAGELKEICPEFDRLTAGSVSPSGFNEENPIHDTALKSSFITLDIQEWWGVDLEIKNHVQKLYQFDSGYTAATPRFTSAQVEEWWSCGQFWFVVLHGNSSKHGLIKRKLVVMTRMGQKSIFSEQTLSHSSDLLAAWEDTTSYCYQLAKAPSLDFGFIKHVVFVGNFIFDRGKLMLTKFARYGVDLEDKVEIKGGGMMKIKIDRNIDGDQNQYLV